MSIQPSPQAFARVWCSSIPIAALAERYGVSVPAVSQRAKRQGLSSRQTRPRWSRERDEALARLREAGLTASEIAPRLGPDVTRGAVLGRAWRLGLATRVDEASRQLSLQRVAA
ncbi:GcrA family cell cycle regulator [uncultured Enterovirga sp.]|uniref:GcrA family cell cycle regulator n=1 Tax=uncultured Enterovirga sp. TaxID=2026352 RepID=UPI0035CC7A4A